MKFSLILSLVIPAAVGQTGTASIGGTVLDAKSQKPIPSALVMATQTGPSGFTARTKSGGDGAFRFQGLPAGTFSLCVQTAGGRYLDVCQWNGGSPTVTLSAGQAAAGVSVRLAPASVLNVQVQDPQKVLSQKTKDGRRPHLAVGVWGPGGLYYPARSLGAAPAANIQGGVTYNFQLPVPRDTTLTLHVASRDVNLGDAGGVPLPANASRQAFQHATGDPNPRRFAFTVMGLLP
jgi:hypothetical protein